MAQWGGPGQGIRGAASEIGMNLAEVGEHFSLHLFDGGSGRSVHDGRERLVREWEFRRHRCDVVV